MSVNPPHPCHPCFYPQPLKRCVKIPLKNPLFYAEKRVKIGTFAHDKKLWKITTI